MKITQQPTDGQNLIRRYGADFVVIGDQEIRDSCLVTVSSFEPWAVSSVDGLTPELLAPVFARRPEVVVLATGARQAFPRAALRAEFATRRIGLEAMEIGAACRTYNVLVGEARQVLAAFLLSRPSKGPE
jgi:uncharacterized protein